MLIASDALGTWDWLFVLVLVCGPLVALAARATYDDWRDRRRRERRAGYVDLTRRGRRPW